MRLTKPLEFGQSVRKSNIAVLCNATLWTLAKMYWIFGKTYCYHRHGRYISVRPHVITSQETANRGK